MPVKSIVTPRFIEGDKGPLFALHHAPPVITQDTECLIVAPSFAEEMNRCRYMCTLLAQAVSAGGRGFLSVDPYGTGDSAGDFIEASWDQCCRDLLRATEYAAELGYRKVSMFAIRLGALQTLEIASSITNLHRLILWQPVINGKAALVQFLRIRIAAAMDRDEQAGTVAEFQQEIEAGQPVAVAGYDLSPNLFKGIEAAKLENHLAFCDVPVGWFTTLASAERKTPQGEIKMMERWRAAGATVNHKVAIGPSYWQVHERALAPELVRMTVDYLDDGPDV